MLPERQSVTTFLDWLRDGRSGFEASDHQYLAAQALVEATLEENTVKTTTLPNWSTLLAPVLCSSEAQQAEFYTLFGRWFKHTEPIIDGSLKTPKTNTRRGNLD